MVSDCSRRRAGSISMLISGARAPTCSTRDTPFTSSRVRRMRSLSSYSSVCASSAATPILMIENSRPFNVTLACSASTGKEFMRATALRMSCSSCWRSTPFSNLAKTSPWFSDALAVSWSIPGMPLSSCSIGRMTPFSTSSGLAPL